MRLTRARIARFTWIFSALTAAMGLIGLPIALSASPAAVPGPAEQPLIIPLEVRIPIAPTSFSAAGRTHLVYELHVTNSGPWNCVLSGLDVVAGDSGARLLASFTPAEIETMLASTWMESAEKRLIAPQTRVVLFVWVSLDRQEHVPRTLRHRLKLKIGEYPQELHLDTYAVTVASSTTVIDSPLKGDRWVAENGPSNVSGHRRTLIPTQGRATIAQRFAIDWVRIDDDGKTYRGDPQDNKSYYAYGAEVLAVTDGIVAQVQDGVPSNLPGENSRAVKITMENVAGNHVVLDIGNGRYALYAHLQPGSLRVKVGDAVKRGQIVGLVGNTGNSTEPHLHFHLTDAISPLGGEGLPYALTSFEIQGHGLGSKIDKKAKMETRRLALPLQDDIVRFVTEPSDHDAR